MLCHPRLSVRASAMINSFSAYRFEILGGIASGKTTLCENLAKIRCQPIFEVFASNPFLNAFYTDPIKFSFETEITFLLQHYHSIKTAVDTPPLVCDFSIILDKAYADVTLTRRQREVFLTVAREVEQELGFPRKVIHLHCPEDVLLARIAKRNRDFEKSITAEYLTQLNQAIQARVDEASSHCDVIAVDSHAINFVHDLDAIPHIAALCRDVVAD
jgi:deoxyadenosine/deoxycytidine kinase